MAILVVVHPCIRRLYTALFPGAAASNASPGSTKVKEDNDKSRLGSDAADTRLIQRVRFDFWFALIFLAALHGFSAVKILGILSINYLIATRTPRVYLPTVTWVFNIGTLFANELLHGYPFSKIANMLSFGSQQGSDAALSSWGSWLDAHSGLVSRWEVLFNITILRLISFNLDYYWSLDYRAGSPVEVCLPFYAPLLLPSHDNI
jgi:hypothetical protein